MSEIHDISSFLFHQFVFIDFSSSDYAEFIRRHSCYRITHGFSRIFGRWPMAGARKVLLLVLSRRFRRWRRFFLRGSFLSHRFHRFSQIFFMESLVNRFVFIGLRGVIGTFLLSDYSRIFADATCSVVSDTLWDRTKRFTRDSIKKSVKICEICVTKKLR